MKHFWFVLMVFVLSFNTACDKDETKSSLAILEEFSIKELPDLAFTIGTDKEVETTAPDGTGLNGLTAVFTISPKAAMYVGAQRQGSGSTKKDFLNPVTYKVVAEDGTTNDYTVKIYTDIVIKNFAITELDETKFIIDGNNITTTVLNGTNLQNLVATFNISTNSKLYVNDIEQISGETANNFDQPLTYTLKSNLESEKTYTVTITEAENQTPTAHAGEDKTYYILQGETTASITLDGSLSEDAEGEITSFEWKEESVVIATKETETVNLTEGIHNITLTVTDSKGLIDTDEVVITVQQVGSYTPIDANATQATKNLLTNLGNIGNSSQFIFGQEFPLSFKLNSLRNDLSTSDCKQVTGDHPGVYGIDPHYMLYKSASQRQLHIDEAKKAYQGGAVVTFDFHQQSKTDGKIYFDDITTASDKSLMYDIVNDNNGSRTWFYAELDDILGMINNDLGFPIVFRLFHEMDGGWFWWGSKATNHSHQLYIDFYKLAVDYIKERTNLVLFAWSPNYSLQESYYPGDDYVDIVGIDIYEPTKSTLKSNLIALTTFAINHNKVAALTETGYRNDYIGAKPAFWNDVVLDAIKEGGNEIRIAWALSWFNAPWASNQSDLFIPNSDSPQTAKDNFIQFKNDDITLFQEDVKALNMYD